MIYRRWIAMFRDPKRKTICPHVMTAAVKKEKCLRNVADFEKEFPRLAERYPFVEVQRFELRAIEGESEEL